ncbi:aspartyl aminopeptidase [Blastomyces gilchristii SLH14081]|uniref:aspartyl aminopeptidase n=2 Tax=Blastomyces TaxID=229219 RepID=A0A179UCS6_BLAGS|nr:aspartyl aminopeptidase [Blastomyces gilchristii SLH14081]EGE77302.1 aspartyl aminopeptidase [Blastomyces dermatitidis ATCC 18188]EQL38609.1 aspartyl aminopeptidase [Blastomyces dermatitidis ATCC 26199]OAT05533.1 aspartyl aminopeptidase [Blastomyces gilchristii SLH14081]
MISKLWGESLSTARHSIRSLGRASTAHPTTHFAHNAQREASLHPQSNAQKTLSQWHIISHSRRLSSSSLSSSSTSATMTEINFKAQANDFLSFVNASPTPFHAVASAGKRLINAGFREVKERDSWASICKPGGKYYVTRNGSTIIAFAIGKKWKPGNSISMIGAHTDSPCLRIKPVSKKSGDGFVQVGVETYGGGIWHTWFDRDLGIAGRAMVRNANGTIEAKLVHIDRPILRIPTLAIHLDRQETFSFNKETQLFPIAGLVAAELARRDGDSNSKEDLEIRTKGNDNGNNAESNTPFAPLKSTTDRHHPYLVELIASELSVNAQDVVDFEMLLYDTQKACLGGLLDEFIFSARLDNLNMSFCATMGLLNSLTDPKSLDNDSSIRLIALFDHEEIGSRTAQGADSNALPAILRRLSVLPGSSTSSVDISTAYEQSLSTSFLLSADMAHSVNPNYAIKYESDHKPEMNKGPVIKINANARYATNSPGIVLLQECARLAGSAGNDTGAETASSFQGVPLQLFVVRNDSSCGSTIGPMLSAALGVRTLDMGNAQLSMHSIRETGGTNDVGYAIKLFESFFQNYSGLARTILVD